MDAEIVNRVEKLRLLRNDHIEMGNLIVSAHGCELYLFDLLAVATLNRSMCLLKGFCDLLLSENYIAATPLVRLQLDNCLRFFAGWLVTNPHDFALQILAGKQVNKLQDRGGKKMTDKYLVEKFSENEGPKFLTIYTHTSGYIHLSNLHMFNAIRNESGRLKLKITDNDAFVPTELYLDTIISFEEVTKQVLRYMSGWARTKEHSELTKKDDGISDWN